jgi:hypothetical protein
MVEKVVEAKEATETLHAEEARATVTHTTATEGPGAKVIMSVVIPSTPSKQPAEAEEFTRANFESALDKVSRPVKGKYAHVPYSSEDLIREKREEVDLEDS